MNCQHCNVKIGAEFVAAIKKNECPACSKQIMPQNNLVAFLSLQELLKQNTPSVDVDKIASLIIANFDIKQRFAGTVTTVAAEALPYSDPNEAVNTAISYTSVLDTIKEDEGVDQEIIKSNSIAKQQRLQKLRDEALAEATFATSVADALSENPSIDEEDMLLDSRSLPASKRPATKASGRIDYNAILNEDENIDGGSLEDPDSVLNRYQEKQLASKNKILNGSGSFRR